MTVLVLGSIVASNLTTHPQFGEHCWPHDCTDDDDDDDDDDDEDDDDTSAGA
jgi:hypothetical protein